MIFWQMLSCQKLEEFLLAKTFLTFEELNVTKISITKNVALAKHNLKLWHKANYIFFLQIKKIK